MRDGKTRAASGTSSVRVVRATRGSREERDDRVAVEAPLEIQLHHASLGFEPVSFGTTMRTPGDDECLAAGLLYGESVIEDRTAIEAIETSTRRPNVVNVRLHPFFSLALQVSARRFSAGSSCGVCGTTGLDAAIARTAAAQISSTVRMRLDDLLGLPARMRSAQARFGDTGGIHAAARFGADAELLSVHEDVGRHNAFDKMVGDCVLAGQLPRDASIVLLSGRASFELVQKAVRAGVEVLAAIGAPSSLAVNLATATGLTLAGFLRPDHCNIYAGGHRLV